VRRPAPAGGGGFFPSTQHSAIIGARGADPVERARAFEVLVAAYWKPTYKHLRVRWRKDSEACRDLTQAFFAIAYEKRYFDAYDPSVARFRTFFKTCLDRFVSKEVQAQGRQKRGGGAVVLSLDFDHAENELARTEPPAPDQLETYFDAEWVRSLMSGALETLRRQCESRGRTRTYEMFARTALAEEDTPRPSYAELATEHGLSVTDVTNHITFARREFRRIVLERLRQLTGSEEEFRSEARAVLGVELPKK